MCGIIGYLGFRDCRPVLLNGLKRLEYRGYDSAGVVFRKNEKLELVKTEGRIEILAEKVNYNTNDAVSTCGIGHTRWATHGVPNSINAHPHRVGRFVFIHNGIIENYLEIKKDVITRGKTVVSDTDSELYGHLVELEVEKGNDFETSARLAFKQLKGSCSIVIIDEDTPDKVIAIRNGTPMVIGEKEANGKREVFIASDVQAVHEYVGEFLFLESGDFVIIDKTSLNVFDLDGNPQKRKKKKIGVDPTSMDLGQYPHYMLKEIHEQPRALIDTMKDWIDKNNNLFRTDTYPELEKVLSEAERFHFSACGTAYYASFVGKYLMESLARVPTEIDLASEFRYRDPILNKKTVFIAVSQSGETADTIAALEEAKRKGAKTLAIVNVRNSTIARMADVTVYTNAGPEIGVASTKAFTTQIAVMYLISCLAARKRVSENLDIEHQLLASIIHIPVEMEKVLSQSDKIKKIAEKYYRKNGFMFIGRGLCYPLALEGALKLKEISYIHAEGYPAGEMKHGPISLVCPDLATVALISPDKLLADKTVSNIEEIKARGGEVIGICCESHKNISEQVHEFISIPEVSAEVFPLLAAIPLQLFAYYVALCKGTDIDKPRNLAKSVTVE